MCGVQIDVCGIISYFRQNFRFRRLFVCVYIGKLPALSYDDNLSSALFDNLG
jgi:hypothetical protein